MTVYYLGDETDIRAQITNTDGDAFTVTGVDVTIKSLGDGTVIRNGETAEFDADGNIWYHETFSAGYADGTTYRAVFAVAITLNGVDYLQYEPQVTFFAKAP